MLQRVVIARALRSETGLLLMDEPYGQLDIELRSGWKTSCQLEENRTHVFITHNIE